MFVFKDLVPPNGSIEFITALEEALEWLYYDIYVAGSLDHDALWPEGVDVLMRIKARFWESVDDSELSISTKNHVALLFRTISIRALQDVYDERSKRSVPPSPVEAIKVWQDLVEIPHTMSVLIKMQEGSLKDLSDKELKRVFSHLAGPATCLRSAKAMILSGNLTSIRDIPQLINYDTPLYATPAVMNAIWG